MDRVALYARVSTDEQDIENQVDKLEKWAEYKDVEYETFKDDGVSAVAEDRPAFDYMMEMIQEFDAVVFTQLDRFGRSINDLSTWAHELKEMDIDLVMTEQNIDTSTMEGELLFNVLSVIADYERKLIRKRMEEGYRQALEDDKVGRPKEDINLDKLERMYKAGANVTYLATKFDVSRPTIYERLRELGLHNGDDTNGT